METTEHTSRSQRARDIDLLHVTTPEMDSGEVKGLFDHDEKLQEKDKDGEPVFRSWTM